MRDLERQLRETNVASSKSVLHIRVVLLLCKLADMFDSSLFHPWLMGLLDLSVLQSLIAVFHRASSPRSYDVF